MVVVGSQVVYNSAAVYSRMGQWEQARELLLSASQEKGAMRSSSIAPGLESISVSLEPCSLCLVFFAISVYIHMHENVIICTCVSEGGGSEPNPGARWGCLQAQETGSRTAPTEGLSWKGQGTREPLSPETRSIVTHHDKRL